MTTKYYADATTGASLGGRAPAPAYEVRTPQVPIIDEETGAEIPQPDLVETVTPTVTPPPNSVETPGPPDHGAMIWDGTAWVWPVEVLNARMVAAVKAEAERRILDVMPEWRQRNALAAGQAAVMAHGSDPATWPAALQTEHTAAMAAWAAINAIRAASDALEAMDPIPADYAADHHWP